jgi:peptidyl-prolyl cis-trans isomerase C
MNVRHIRAHCRQGAAPRQQKPNIVGGTHFMKMHKHVVVVLVALFIAVTGCSKADGPVIAKVNRGSITEADFKKQLEDLAPQMQQAVVADPKARKEFLEDLIGIELVIQEAKRQGLDKDAEYKKRQETLKKELERRIQEDTKNELFNALLKKELGDKLAKVTEPTPAEIKSFYDKNKDKIRNASGKVIALKEVEPQLKQRIMQERRRDLYIEYSKGLKAKASISVDDKALDAAVAALSQPKSLDLSNMKVMPAPKAEAAK